MAVHGLRPPDMYDNSFDLRKGEQRQVEKALERAAADGVMTDDEQDAIIKGFRGSRGVVRDFYLTAAEKLATSARPPTGSDALLERMERRDQILDEAAHWGDVLVTAGADGSLSPEDRQSLVQSFLALSLEARKAVLAMLPNYRVSGAHDLLVEIQIATAKR